MRGVEVWEGSEYEIRKMKKRTNKTELLQIILNTVMIDNDRFNFVF